MIRALILSLAVLVASCVAITVEEMEVNGLYHYHAATGEWEHLGTLSERDFANDTDPETMKAVRSILGRRGSQSKPINGFSVESAPDAVQCFGGGDWVGVSSAASQMNSYVSKFHPTLDKGDQVRFNGATFTPFVCNRSNKSKALHVTTALWSAITQFMANFCAGGKMSQIPAGWVTVRATNVHAQAGVAPGNGEDADYTCEDWTAWAPPPVTTATRVATTHAPRHR